MKYIFYSMHKVPSCRLTHARHIINRQDLATKLKDTAGMFNMQQVNHMSANLLSSPARTRKKINGNQTGHVIGHVAEQLSYKRDRMMQSFLTTAISARSSHFRHCTTTNCVAGIHLVTSWSSARQPKLWQDLAVSLGCAHRYLGVLSESARANFLSGTTNI